MSFVYLCDGILFLNIHSIISYIQNVASPQAGKVWLSEPKVLTDYSQLNFSIVLVKKLWM